MNARGLPLLPSDIFKSQVIGEISESSRREYADRWENLEQELSREEFGTLFVYIRRDAPSCVETLDPHQMSDTLARRPLRIPGADAPHRTVVF